MTRPAARFPDPTADAFHDLMHRVTEHYNAALSQPEPTPLYDAMAELPSANPWRRAYLQDVIERLSGRAA